MFKIAFYMTFVLLTNFLTSRPSYANHPEKKVQSSNPLRNLQTTSPINLACGKNWYVKISEDLNLSAKKLDGSLQISGRAIKGGTENSLTFHLVNKDSKKSVHILKGPKGWGMKIGGDSPENCTPLSTRKSEKIMIDHTVTGDRACYIEYKKPDGKTDNHFALFDFCDKKHWGKNKVAKLRLEKLTAFDCEGNPECQRSEWEWVVYALED